MVVDCGRTGGGDVGGKVLGVVLNRMGPSADGHYYYYSYYSYYSRGSDARCAAGRWRPCYIG